MRRAFELEVRTVLFLILVSIGATGCSGSRVSLRPKGEQERNGPGEPDRTIQISPGHCRIVGTIVSIDSVLDKDVPRDPCSIEPCNANVRVDSVIGYGNAFPPLSPGNIIEVHFYFTLAPTTKDLFPDLTEFLPGLQAGSTFTGDIDAIPRPKQSAGSKIYGIYGYRKEH